MRTGLGAAALVSFASMTGCASMSVGEPVVTEVPKASFERPSENGKTAATVEQAGTQVSVRAARLCNVTRIDTAERTTVREHHNDTPQNDWWAGIFGVGLAGAGVYALVAPESFAKDGKLSPKEVTASGIGMVSVGAALLAIPVIDYFREHSVAERKVERVERPGPTLRSDVACGPPPPDARVTLLVDGEHPIQLGAFGPRGDATFDLDDTVPRSTALTPKAPARLVIGGQETATLGLSALYEKREAAAWSKTSGSACATSIEEEACASHAAYVRDFPAGEHIVEAGATLAAAEIRRRAAADEQAWSTLDLAACQTPPTRDPSAIDGACAPLARYLEQFSAGAHVEQVTTAWRKGDAIATRLREDEERRADAAAASSAAVVPGAFIPYEGNGGGPTLCRDGMWSHSSGRGTCSHHGGVAGGGSRGGTHRSKRR